MPFWSDVLFIKDVEFNPPAYAFKEDLLSLAELLRESCALWFRFTTMEIVLGIVSWKISRSQAMHCSKSSSLEYLFNWNTSSMLLLFVLTLAAMCLCMCCRRRRFVMSALGEDMQKTLVYFFSLSILFTFFFLCDFMSFK